MKIIDYILRLLINVPLLNRYSKIYYRKLGVILGKNSKISNNITIIGKYSNIYLKKNAEINTGCFLLAKENITIGENSTLAYQVTILTSSNPNSPYNKLSKIYKSIKEPVTIGNNTWIGAKATILPGVKIGDYCVVAAGAVVNKDVSDYSVVGGIPAKIIKKIDRKLITE